LKRKGSYYPEKTWKEEENQERSKEKVNGKRRKELQVRRGRETGREGAAEQKEGTSSKRGFWKKTEGDGATSQRERRKVKKGVPP